MARLTVDLLGWVKKRKGMLSLTAKGKKALTDIEKAANELVRCALTEVPLHTFDLYDDEIIGNLGIAYSVWLLHEFGAEWHTGAFYQQRYEKAFGLPEIFPIYECRVLSRLFYWLGIVESKVNKDAHWRERWSFRATDLLQTIFSFKKP